MEVQHRVDCETLVPLRTVEFATEARFSAHCHALVRTGTHRVAPAQRF